MRIMRRAVPNELRLQVQLHCVTKSLGQEQQPASIRRPVSPFAEPGQPRNIRGQMVCRALPGLNVRRGNCAHAGQPQGKNDSERLHHVVRVGP